MNEATIKKTEAIRKEIGKLIRDEAKRKGVSRYFLQKAMKRGQFLPPYTMAEGVMNNTTDYGFGTLLLLLDALGMEVQVMKDGRPLLKTPAEERDQQPAG